MKCKICGKSPLEYEDHYYPDLVDGKMPDIDLYGCAPACFMVGYELQKARADKLEVAVERMLKDEFSPTYGRYLRNEFLTDKETT